MRRPTAALLSAMLLIPAMSMAEPVDTPSCETRDTAYDLRDVTCSIASTADGRAFQFKADFSGGHDDTMASMSLSLDDKPLACEGGGKLRLMGEDGNVSLFCRFVPGTISGAPATLRAVIKWSHAEYTGAGLSRAGIPSSR